MTDVTRYELTYAQWRDDVLHRIVCRDSSCDDYAHTYVHAIAQGRVLVDGKPIVINLDDPATPAAMQPGGDRGASLPPQ